MCGGGKMHAIPHFSKPPEHTALGRSRQHSKESVPTPIGPPQFAAQECSTSSQSLGSLTEPVTPGQVTVDINSDYAVITFCHRAGVLGTSAIEQIWLGISECARRVAEVRMVFLWAREAPGSRTEGSSMTLTGTSLDMLCLCIRRLPQPVFGFADGFVCSAGTCILAACDLIIAVSWARFELVEERPVDHAQVLPLCLLRCIEARVLQQLLEIPGTVTAQRACDCGLVTHIVPAGESLYDVQENLRNHSATLPSMIRTMRDSRHPFAGQRLTTGTSNGFPEDSTSTIAPSGLLESALGSGSGTIGNGLPASTSNIGSVSDGLFTGASDPFAEDSVYPARGGGFLESALGTTSTLGSSNIGSLGSGIVGSNGLSGLPASTRSIGSGAGGHFGGAPPEGVCPDIADELQLSMPSAGHAVPSSHNSGACYSGADSAVGDGDTFSSQSFGWRPNDNGWKGRGARGAPKKKDLMTNYLSHDGPITSFMLCNIPCRVTQQQLAEVINSMGFQDKYDFLYLPTGGRSSKTASNLGYGFINFADPADGPGFIQEFSNYKFDCTSSSKVCMVKPAHIQGLQQNMRHFSQANSTRLPLTRGGQATSPKAR